MKKLELKAPEGVGNYQAWKDYLKKINRAITQTKYYLKNKGKGSLESKKYLQQLESEKKKVVKKTTLKISKKSLASLQKSNILSKEERKYAETLSMEKRVKYIKKKYKRTELEVYQKRLEQAMIESASTGVPLKKPKKPKSLEEIFVGGVMKGSGSTTYVKGEEALKLQLKRYGRAGLSNFRKDNYIRNFKTALSKRGYDLQNKKIIEFFEKLETMQPNELSVALKNGIIPDIVDAYLVEDFVEGKGNQKPLGEKLDYFESQEKWIKEEAKRIELESYLEAYQKEIERLNRKAKKN